MGKKWIYRLKTEDCAYVAQRLNIALEDRIRGGLCQIIIMRRRTTRNLSVSGPNWRQENKPKHHANKRRGGKPSGKLMFRQPAKRGSKERCKPGKENNSTDLWAQPARLCKGR